MDQRRCLLRVDRLAGGAGTEIEREARTEEERRNARGNVVEDADEGMELEAEEEEKRIARGILVEDVAGEMGSEAERRVARDIQAEDADEGMKSELED